MSRFTVSCQFCNKVLVTVENCTLSDETVSEYLTSCRCNALQLDGVTEDGQDGLVVREEEDV